MTTIQHEDPIRLLYRLNEAMNRFLQEPTLETRWIVLMILKSYQSSVGRGLPVPSCLPLDISRDPELYREWFKGKLGDALITCRINPQSANYDEFAALTKGYADTAKLGRFKVKAPQ